MKEFTKIILNKYYKKNTKLNINELFDNSPLLKYLNLKMGAISGNSKTRRNLANIYAIYSLLYFYKDEFYNKPIEYQSFLGYDYSILFEFYRGLYWGNKLQNHALNSRVNSEFKNKIANVNNDLIVINDGKYAIHIDYLYVNKIDISKVAIQIIEKYIYLLKKKDNKLSNDIENLIRMDSAKDKKIKISEMLDENTEARIFEIVSYSILKNHYKNKKIYIGYSINDLKEEYLTLYKTGRTNANDGGIDFVMKPLGRFFQVSEVNDYDKYLLDIDKVLHFPITFVIKTLQSKESIHEYLNKYIEKKSGWMKIIKDRYDKAIEEIITINELRIWLNDLTETSINDLLRDIELYYKLEFNLFDD